MAMRGRTSILREAMKSLLAQHKDKGIEFALIEQVFGSIDRCRVINLLRNLRSCGEAYCKKSVVGRTGIWFPGSADPEAEDMTVSPADWRRLDRARRTDQANPIVFCGQNLRAGRCASVWEYARHHQEMQP